MKMDRAASVPSKLRDIQLARKISGLDWADDPGRSIDIAEALIVDELKALGYEHTVHAMGNRRGKDD